MKKICAISLFLFFAVAVGKAQESWEVQGFSIFDGKSLRDFLVSPVFLLPLLCLIVIIALLWSGLIVGLWRQLISGTSGPASHSPSRSQYRQPPSLSAAPRTGLAAFSSQAGYPGLLAAGDNQASPQKDGERSSEEKFGR